MWQNHHHHFFETVKVQDILRKTGDYSTISGYFKKNW